MKAAILLAGSLLIASAIAQEPADPKPEQATPEARMQELQQLQQKCIADWQKAQKEAQKAAANAEPGKAVPAVPMRPDFGPCAKKAMEFATEFAGTDGAVQFLVIAMQASSESADKKQALDVLLANHADSDELAKIGSMLPYLGQILDDEAAGTKAIERLSESKNGAVRGWASYAKLSSVIEKADRESAEYGKARETLTAILDGGADKRLASTITEAIELREKWGAGNAAADISGVDLDGVAFKLSDYKGKVIFLDFWGDW